MAAEPRGPAAPRPRGRRRVALFGGTFDPPHVGHLVVAEEARVALELDEVRFVVAGQPWMRKRCSPGADRVEMVTLAVAGAPGFTVTSVEVDRAGPTYTVDTLEALASAEPDSERLFLVGADAAARLSEWRDINRCLALATFVVVTRGGYDVVIDPALEERVVRLEVPAMDVSATDLRARFATGRAVRYQLPDAVERYVRDRRLYARGDDPV